MRTPIPAFIPPGMMDDARLSAAGLGSIQEVLAAMAQQQGFQPQPAAMQPAPQEMPPQAPQQVAQAQPQPQGGGGGFLSGIQNFLDGGRGQKVNQTVQWLQQQGLDGNTAQALARNPGLLQDYLKQRLDPMQPLQMEKLGLEIDQMRNPRMAPGEEARLGLDRERFDFERSNADKTNDIREYQFYVRQEREAGRQPASMFEWDQARRRSGATNVDARNMGNIPPGYRVEYDQQGNPIQMVPIPGGPAAMEAEAAQRATDAKGQKQRNTADIVTQDIDRALSIIDNSNLPSTGFIGDLLSGVGGTSARDLKGLLDTVKANSGFEALQAMRDSSPTGGALGQVTERELAFLQATIGNLEQSQSAQQLKDNLNRVWNAYQYIVHGENGFTPRRLSFDRQEKPLSEMSTEELEAIINGDR
jgi:hypothetical protein